MATQANLNLAQSLYIAYYGRAADSEGLQYWANRIETEADFGTVLSAFGNSAEYTDRFGEMSNDALIDNLYQQMFDRSADFEGLQFYSALLASGDKTLAQIAYDILAGAQEPDTSAIAGKLAAANDYTATAGEDYVLEDGISAVRDANVEAPDLTLTKDADNLTGTDGDDVFGAPLDVAIDGLVGAQTLQGQDVLDGGEGQDQLRAELNATGTTWNPTISNIEEYYLTATSGTLIGPLPLGGALDLSRATGYEQLWNLNSRNDLSLQDVREVAVLGMDGVRGGTTYGVGYNLDTPTIGEQTVVATNVGSAGFGSAALSITGTGVNTLSLDVSNGVRLDLEDNADGMTTFNLSGDGTLNLTGDSRFNNLANLNAAAYAGDLTLDVSGSTTLENILTGDGDDLIYVNNETVVNNADQTFTADLGEGFDILAIRGADDADDISALDFTGGVSNVENLALVDIADLDSDDAVLNLDGVDESLQTLWFFDGIDGSGGSLALRNSPVEELTVNAIDATGGVADDFELGLLDTGNLVDLTINTTSDLTINDLNAPALETLSVSQVGVDANGDALGDLSLSITSDEDHNVSALESLEATAEGNAIVSLDASDEDADVDALVGASVESGETATLNMTGFASEVPAAEAVLAAAEDVLSDAQDDRDAALIAESNAQDARDAALAARDAAQADLDAEQVIVNTEQVDFNAAEAALDAAQAEVDGTLDVLGGFGFTVGGGGTGAVNQSELRSLIDTVASLDSAQKANLKATVPGVTFFPPADNFNQQSEFDNWLNVTATDFLEVEFNIAALTTDRDDAQNDLNGAIADRDAAKDIRDDAQDELDAAQLDLDAAQSDLADAETALADAQEAVDEASASLNAARDGSGFAGLEDIVVDGVDDANVNLTDVYGAFTLEVVAGDNANVTLFNTAATSATVEAGNGIDYTRDGSGDIIRDANGNPVAFDTVVTSQSMVSIGGDTYGNQDLASVAVSGTWADVSLSDDLGSLRTLDFTGVTHYLDVDASAADFGDLTGNNYVTYLVGETSNLIDDFDVTFSANDAREVFSFVGENIGEVQVSDFTAGADPVTADRIDLSSFGFTNAGQLNFVEDGANLVIEDLAGGPADFSGSIELVGVLNDVTASEFASLNVIYA